MTLPVTPPRTRSAARHLTYFALIVAGPLLLLVGALLWRAATLERGQLDHRMRQVLDALVADVDRDVDRQLTILRTLASSPLLAAEDWPAFYDQAKSALTGKGYVVLVDTEGRQLVNTYVPFGEEPATTGDPESVRRMRDTGQPVISNLFVSKVVKEPVYNVSIPVIRGRELRYVMSVGLLPTGLRAILDEQGLDPEWTTLIWDGQGQILAHSAGGKRWLGRLAPEGLRALHPGTVASVPGDGGDVIAAVARAASSEWRIAAAYPAGIIERQIGASLAVWGATIVVVSGLVLGLAWLFGRDLTRPLAAATGAARALGRGEAFEVVPSRIEEVNAVSAALVRAQRDVDASSAALRHSEEQLRTAAEAAEFGAHRYDVAENRTYRSPQFLRILGATDDEQTSTFESGLQWVHPEDRAGVQAHKRALIDGGDTRYQLDYRILRRDGAVRWVMDRGQIVRDPASGRALQVIGVVLDITEMKDAEQRQRLLFAELNHRVKNTLAIVQSLAKQSLRGSADPGEFAASFEARLQSLAKAHDLLTRDSWQGARLGDIVRAALEPFRAEGRSIRIEGPEVAIPSGPTVTLSLMLHELATNAAKYGALSASAGSLDLVWQIADRGSSADVELRWIETGGPPASAPRRSGFGSRLLEGGARQLGGQIDIEYAAAGLRCTLRFPVPGLAKHVAPSR